MKVSCTQRRRAGGLTLIEVVLATTVIAVAAAGGSGGGMITCLLSMERWIQHVRARVFDLIPVNRWSREYKLVAIRDAARTMVQEALQ